MKLILIISFCLLAFNSFAQNEIFRVNHDSTVITFAGCKYIKHEKELPKETIIIFTDTSKEAKLEQYYRGMSTAHVPTEMHVHSVDTLPRITIKDNVDYKIGYPCPANKMLITNDTLK